MKRPEIESIVFRAIDRVNELLPPELALEKHPQELLAASGSKLDSMGFVNFLFFIEDVMEKEHGVQLDLADAKGSAGGDPLESVESLINHLAEIGAKD